MWNKNKHVVRIFCVLFVLGFSAGALCMEMKKEELLYGTGFMDSYTIAPIKYLEVDGRVLLGYVLRQRLLGVVLLLLLATTYLGCGAVYLFFVWNGILWGLLFVGCMERYGFKGLLFVISSMIPQIILYLPAFLKLAIQVRDFCRLLYFDKGRQTTSNKNSFYRFCMQGVLVIVLVMVGCLLESYVNSYFVKLVIELYLSQR